MKLAPVVTAEHASNRVAARERDLFAGAEHALRSHRGWDPGALELGRLVARRLSAPLFAGTVSRLLIDLNRSPGHPQLFSRWTRSLSRQERERLFARYWLPFRTAVRHAVDAELAAGRSVVHLSCHSFTPRLAGKTRNADIGLLYDPSRTREVELVDALALEIRRALPGVRLRRNYPYRGTADGHTSALRRSLHAGRYLGIEIELSQARGADTRRAVASALARVLA